MVITYFLFKESRVVIILEQRLQSLAKPVETLKITLFNK